ncbi:hypothetical protein [Microvirga makkahensis]|uniref:Uncharacterized protein n=1 Tax=Microvirga makkahensis TaxID=1128670 RepID=A0A7X3MX88_9HYPH|nr:hypothetical protein [Microvirga makkahensis]MXQ14874.1 hypothetical protein [Microvirga makkahensis]
MAVSYLELSFADAVRRQVGFQKQFEGMSEQGEAGMREFGFAVLGQPFKGQEVLFATDEKICGE